MDRTLSYIRELGCKAGVALNPATPLDTIHHCLDRLDLVLVMTVNPGFGGQRFIDAMLPKVQQAAAMIEGRDIQLQVDGGITAETAPKGDFSWGKQSGSRLGYLWVKSGLCTGDKSYPGLAFF